MKKGLMLAACCLLLSGVVTGCSQPTTPPDDDDMFEENTDPETEGYRIALVGADFNNRDPKAAYENDATCLTKVDGENRYTITVDVKANSEFKMVGQADWSPNQYGMEDIDWNLSTAELLVGKKEDYNEGTSNRSNIKTTHDAKITIDFYPYPFLEPDLGLEDGRKFVITEVK